MTFKPKRIKNRKNVQVNKRNKTFNTYYLSPIKTLTKKLVMLAEEYTINPLEKKLINIKKIYSLLTSLLDKAAKKNVLHKNTVAKKKSQNALLLKSNSINIFK